MNENELLTRVETLERRAGVQELIHEYALYARLGKDAELAKLFAEDGVFEVRDGTSGDLGNSKIQARSVGPEAIAAFFRQSAAAGVRVCPLISNVIVRLDGTKATSTCAMTTTVWPSGARTTGQYEDSCCFTDRWRFTSRIYTILGQFGS
jgi:hypothetical protein